MKNIPYTLLCAALLGGVFASCSSPSPTVSRVSVSAPMGNDASLSGKVFTEVNTYRASKNKCALERHAGLDRLAQQHCDFLAKHGAENGLYGAHVSHDGFENRAFVAKQSYQIMTLGENVVASTNRSSQHLVQLWVGSKSHEHNMRNDWTHTGVATAINSNGMVISTQLFGTSPETSHGVMAGEPTRYNQQW